MAQIYYRKAYLNNENSTGSVVIEILSFRQKNLTTLHNRIFCYGSLEFYS